MTAPFPRCPYRCAGSTVGGTRASYQCLRDADHVSAHTLDVDGRVVTRPPVTRGKHKRPEPGERLTITVSPGAHAALVVEATARAYSSPSLAARAVVEGWAKRKSPPRRSGVTGLTTGRGRA